jgi:hypothetical protein
MLRWLFAVLLVLNLALFYWGYQHKRSLYPEPPPVPEGRYQIRLLSEVETARPAPGAPSAESAGPDTGSRPNNASKTGAEPRLPATLPAATTESHPAPPPVNRDQPRHTGPDQSIEAGEGVIPETAEISADEFTARTQAVAQPDGSGDADLGGASGMSGDHAESTEQPIAGDPRRPPSPRPQPNAAEDEPEPPDRGSAGRSGNVRE